MVALIVVALVFIALLLIASRLAKLNRAFNDLIEFATVQPNAPAIRAIIYFYAITVGHYKCCITIWAFHISVHLGFLQFTQNRGECQA